MSEKDYRNGFHDGYAESLKLGEMGKIERARKQGAVEELEKVMKNQMINTFDVQHYCRERIKELRGEQK